MATKTVKAWSTSEFGLASQVIKLGEIQLPGTLGPKEVLLKVKAAALNPVDVYIVSGNFQNGEGVKFPYVPALDYSGVVEEVGSEVTKVKAGDEVYGWTKFYNPGTLAEYTIIEESSLAKKPSNLSFAEAAAFPLVSLTAFQAFQTGGLKEGDKVLITAAAGGVGAHGIQIAKSYYKAAEIAGTSSKSKHELLKKLGATTLIDYHEQKFEEVLSDYDLVLDGTKESEKALKVVKKDTGKVVTIIDFTGPESVIKYIVQPLGEDLEKLTPFLESGEIKVVLDEGSPWKFEDANKAFARLESNRATGKVVVEL